MIPSPTDLMYFLEVANTSNLSRAAESLGISQPSLTLAMQRLENGVGTAILTRHKKGVSLTKAGKQLLAHTRHLLQHWENLKSQTLASVHEVQGCITIGCHPSVAMYSLPLFLASLMSTHPKLEIALKHDISRRITEQVISLAIDIGIVINPVRHPDVVIKKLGDDRVTLWRSKHKNETQDLENQKAIILCDPELTQTQNILKNLRKYNIGYSRLLPSHSLEVIAELTKAGCGIGILPTKIAQVYGLTPINKAPYYKDEICLVYRGENREVKAFQAINEAIKQGFASQNEI